MASVSKGHLGRRAGLARLAMAVAAAAAVLAPAAAAPTTRIGVRGTTWTVNGQPTAPGTPAEGLLMNVRMVQAVFEDTGPT